jgi:pimeloyl-ACP methyl ester carboxylesterase
MAAAAAADQPRQARPRQRPGDAPPPWCCALDPARGYAVEPGAASDSEPDVHEDYVSAYDLGRFAESARFVRHYPEQNPVLRDLLPKITTPTQIVAGRGDDLVPWSNNQYLDDLLPNSEIHPLDAGHFAWEQAAEEYGRLVVDWVSGGYRRIAAA